MRRPDWPDGTPQQRLHLDLWVDDLKAAHEKAVSLGARLLQPADDLEAAEVLVSKLRRSAVWSLERS